MAASASTSFVEQEEDEFDKEFMFHDHRINVLYNSVRCLPYKNPRDIKFSITFQSPDTNFGSEADEIQSLETNCGSEADEIQSLKTNCESEADKIQPLETNCVGSEADGNRAWGFFYAGSVKERIYFSLYQAEVGIVEKIDPVIEWHELHREDAMEIVHLFEQSLALGKSPMLRYLASRKLGEFYDRKMKRLQAIPYYRIQLEEAEALTRWRHAKVCALYNLCKDLCLCGEVEEAIRIATELEMMGRNDLFTMGISLHCHGHIAWVMSNFEECIEANNDAISILEEVRQNCTSQMSRITLELLPSSMGLATMQIDRSKKKVGISGKVGVGNFGKEPEGAKMLSLIAIMKEEDDKFYRGILLHQYATARNDVELVFAAIRNFLAGWDQRNPTPIKDEQKSKIVERIKRYLTDKCRLEAEESRAWAFFYVGMLLMNYNEQQTFEQPSASIIDMFEESLLYGKSRILKYMASSKIAEIYGEDAKAIKYSKKQLEAAEATTWKGSNSKVYALYLLFLNLCRNSQFEEAIKVQEQLSEVSELLELDDPFLHQVATGLSFHCEGLIADAMGDSNKSKQAYGEAIEVLEAIEFTEIRDDIVSEIYTRMSLAQHYTGKAIADIKAALKLAESRSELVHLDLREYEDWQTNKSSFMKRMKEKMEETRNEMKAKFPQQTEHDICNLFLFEGQTYLINKDLEEAEAVACKLLEIAQSSDDAGLYARALIFAAECAAFCECPENIEAQNDVIESFCIEAQKLVPKDPTNLNLHDIAYREACLYLGMGKFKEAKEKFQVCIHRLLDIQKNLSRSDWRISYLDQMKACFWSIQRTILASAMEKEHGRPLTITISIPISEPTVLNGNEVKDALIWAERERARDLLYGIQQDWDHHAYLNDLSVFDRDDIQAWSEIKDVCSLVGQDTVFLVFTARDLYLWTYFLHAGKEEVSATCTKLHDFPYLSALAALHKDTTAWTTYMCYLFDICIRPFKKRLQDGEIKKIIIVPNGEMSLVPFAALRDNEDEDQPHLIQKYEISIIPSLRMFKHCERRREHLMTKIAEERSALVVGNPTGDLPQAREEAQTVANILKDVGMDTNLLMEKQATTQVVSSFLSTSFWIHMACHAIFKDEPDGALKLSRNVVLDIGCEGAALVLASNESYNDCRNNTSFATKGLLTAENIANHGEIRAVATVLSACSSGRGRLCAEGTLGLTRSLHLAGVPTVVASTWNVDDNATSEFMKSFYTNIRDGCQVATALRITILSMIEKHEHEPLYWAPFFISGSPTLKLPRHTKMGNV